MDIYCTNIIKREQIQNMFNSISSPEFKCCICFESFLNFSNSQQYGNAFKIFYFNSNICECNNLFCLNCKKNLERTRIHICPTCNNNGDYTSVPKMLLNIIKEAKVTCNCKEEIKMDDFCKHIETDCKVIYIKCKQCGVNISRHKIKTHLLEKCPRRLIICCYCRGLVEFQKMANHLKICNSEKECEKCHNKFKLCRFYSHECLLSPVIDKNPFEDCLFSNMPKYMVGPLRIESINPNWKIYHPRWPQLLDCPCYFWYLKQITFQFNRGKKKCILQAFIDPTKNESLKIEQIFDEENRIENCLSIKTVEYLLFRIIRNIKIGTILEYYDHEKNCYLICRVILIENNYIFLRKFDINKNIISLLSIKINILNIDEVINISPFGLLYDHKFSKQKIHRIIKKYSQDIKII